MRNTALTLPARTGRQRLLTSCAIAAGLAALALGGPALAQVAGSGSIVSGSGTITPPGPGATTVTTTTPQSIINWTPTDTAPTGAPIDFLPAGNTLNFVGTGSYTVLNRFVDGSGGSIARQIALNGTVNSYVGSTTGPRGGNIWFYNAGGILIGATGVINVGSLVLTANDINTTGGLFGPGGTIRFNGASGSQSAITVNGTINANVVGNPGGSYVALVAPRVIQAGTIRVDGSAAFVAAEQADIRINNGLFDINVLVGTEGGTAITHSGSTTGPAHEQGDVDQNRIYMVAIPKNDAVTMLVSGQIGYDDAVSAQTDPDGAVVLSAGYNIANGQIAGSPAGGAAANMIVNDTVFRSDTTARASGTFLGQPLNMIPTGPPIAVIPPQNGRITVEGNALFIGDAGATINVNAGRAVSATGNLTVQSGGNAAGPGTAIVNVNGGQYFAGGDLVITADGTVDPVTGNATGGTAALNVTNGGLAGAAGAISVFANGIGGFDSGGEGGDGRGGSATIDVSGAGSVLFGGSITAAAVGVGGGFGGDLGAPDVADNSGDGFGGSATIRVANGGLLATSGSLSASANGVGQVGLVTSGDGTGGTARVEVNGTAATLTAQQTNISAGGTGGGTVSLPFAGTFPSTQAGAGRGGTAIFSINADAASAVNAGTASIDANGVGGGANGIGPVGGDASGGTAGIDVTGGVTAQFSTLTVGARGESGGASATGTGVSTGGGATGGNVNVTIGNGSTLAVSGNLNLDAAGQLGIASALGSATGGNVAIGASGGATLTVSGLLGISAFGGLFSGVSTSSSESAAGGDVDIVADGATINVGNFAVDASSLVPNVDTVSGTALGGSISLRSTNGGSIASTNISGSNFFDANATTGVSSGGSAATGGTIALLADGGSIDLPTLNFFSASGVSGGAASPSPSNPVGAGGSILIDVRGATGSISFGSLFGGADGRTAVASEGGPGSISDTAGNGEGGTVTIEVQDGTLTGDTIDLSASGFGGGSGTNSGTGRGGVARYVQTGGTVTVGDMAIRADGFGGPAVGASGTGIGGTATIDLIGGTIDAAEIIATANGEGGIGSVGNDDDPANITDGGLGGQGIGGTATVNINGNAVVNAGLIGAYATGAGGEGGQFINVFSFGGTPGTPGNGGSAVGGSATVNLISGTVTASEIVADASAVGGDGGSSFFSSSSGAATGIGVGGTGGDGSGGVATINIQMGVDVSDSVSAISRGTGGAGGLHNVGGNGGGGFGGLAQAIVENFETGTLDVTLDSTGRGGDGAAGRDGNGGNGGNGQGGASRAEANGPGAVATVVETSFLAEGIGGNGGNGQLGFGAFQPVGTAGGNGGDGRGGAIEIVATNGATLNLGVISGDVVVLASTGRGGSGGTGSNNFGSTLLPGPDGIFGTPDDIVQNFVGGNGGTGGAGIGGTVLLNANGGTITSNGESVEINVNGVSGEGGNGGDGTGGSGGNGGGVVDGGGTVFIEASAGDSGAGLVDLGNTVINANGFIGGRIVIRSESTVNMASLDASALGFANPTGGDLEEAASGIFLAANGGTIATAGAMTLTTDSSVGIYNEGAGQVSADGDLTIDAGDQIDIRHAARGGNAAPSITATGNLTANAVNGISGTAGSLIAADGTLALTASAGPISVDRLDSGNDIVIAAAGAVSVEHAEAVNDFIASGASFRTGLNSIITGGDILVNAPGAVDLGNSTAGGQVQASGQSILFNTIGAGGPVFLTATGNTAGAEGISGGSIDAGGDIVLNATRIGITGTLTTNGSLFAVGSAGPVAIALAEVEDDISIFAGGDLTGTYNAEGNISLTSTANINASANATGFQSSSSGPPIASSVFINAGGDVTLNDNSATGMFGVNAGGAVAMNGGTIGEDLLVQAGTTATVTGVTAGDDILITAPGGIVATGLVTTGAGRDDRSLVFAPSSPTAPALFQIVASPPDGSNIVLNAAAGDITASNLNAAADLTATAAGVIAATGPLRAGGNVALTAASAELATLVTPVGERISTVDAGGNVTIAVTGAVTGGVVRAGGDIGISAGTTASLLEIAAATGDVVVTADEGMMIDTLRSGGTTTLSSPDGNIIVNSLDTDGAVSASAQAIEIVGQNSLNFANLTTTGGDASVRTSGNLAVTTASVAGLADLRAGNDLSVDQLAADNVNLEADRDMTLGNVTTAGALVATAIGTATINGTLAGPNLTVTSGDINIASTGRIGQLGTTTSVLVTNISTENPTFIGGTGTRNGWHLDADEITRIFGGDITVRGERLEFSQGSSVGSARSPDVFVEGFTINAAQQLGPNGTFLITTPGKMRVRGDVRFTGMSDSQNVNLFGRDSVEVILGSGSIHLSGQSPDQLAGNLTIEADDIVIATTQAIADIAGMTSTAAIDARLAQNDGITSDIGALAASRITLNHNLDDSVYIQNSGTGTAFADRRGITFGQGGLFINGPGNQDSLVINAVHRNASGALVTGLDVIPLVNINAPTGSSTVVQTGFNAQSTINGCLIGNVASCSAPVRPSEDSSFPVQDVIDDPAEDEDGAGQSLPVPLITMRDLDPLSGEPLLDDPVTGAGNDDLWTPTEGP